MRTTLLAAASALVLSAVAANAAPALTSTAVNLRNGPGTQYAVITTVPGGATVDVGGCSGGWCTVSWNGAEGYMTSGALQMAGAPGAVAVAPTYAEPGYDVYADDYGPYAYDYDYYGGPFIGGYGFGFRHDHRSGWNGRGWNGGQWRAPTVTGQTGPRPGFQGNFRGFGGGPRMSAPVGLRSGGPIGHVGGPSIGAIGHPGGQGRR